MSIPARYADPSNIVQSDRTFFVTTQACRKKRLLQSDRNATLLIVESFEDHQRYIAANPVTAGLATSQEEFPWCFTTLARAKSLSPRSTQLRSHAGGT